VPAEEYVEVQYRASLGKEGKLFFLGGKPPLAAVDLLWEDAEKAKEILAEHRPAMTKGESLHFRKVCSGRNCSTEKRGSPNCGEDLQIPWGSYSGL